MTSDSSRVTRLLAEWRQGSESASDQLISIVYDELRRIARRQMRQQGPGHTLQTTALVHEAYIRLAGDSGKNWQNRAHFFGVAATAMRHILVDHARAHQTGKRGGAHQSVPLDDAIASIERPAELVALDDVLTVLATLHPRQSKVVEMRYFGGLNVEETAEVLQISPDTVMRDWRAAKAWLHRELGRGSYEPRQAHDS
jgi:RNA polymerase sigma-70 factor (ECF subfamily)